MTKQPSNEQKVHAVTNRELQIIIYDLAEKVDALQRALTLMVSYSTVALDKTRQQKLIDIIAGLE